MRPSFYYLSVIISDYVFRCLVYKDCYDSIDLSVLRTIIINRFCIIKREFDYTDVKTLIMFLHRLYVVFKVHNSFTL